jgi:eukaryotic-like serine/threonine-protein kinase
VEPAMNAKIREQPANHLVETIDFLHTESGPDRPEGSHDMPRTTPQGQHRYTFGSGARPLEGYTIKRAVGRGGFGEVYYATSDSGKEVALKLITRNLEIERRGVAQCMNLKCPNLLAIHDIKTNDTGDTFVIMEFVAGPSLSSVLAQYPNGMPEAEIRAWLKGLVDGVAYLHDHGIVHRDLKPANLFMEEGVVKIGDYGLSKMISSEQASNHSESVGTCHYMAPEIRNGKYNKPIDIYAMGIILFEMITGRVPFEGETAAEILLKHLTNRPDLSKLQEPFKSIVGQALAKDPAHRQASVVALLPPDEVQRPRDVRFIGEGKVASPAPPPRPKAPDDDIFRITDEEPVLYIGPDTKPPRAKVASYNPWTRRSPQPQPNPARRPMPPRPVPAPNRVGQRVRLIATSPLIPPEPPPTPQPLPPGRIRLGELAASMLWAAPWAALLSLLVGALMQVDLTRRPQDLGYLFVMTLASSWIVLVGNKFAEGREFDPTLRRGVQFALGVFFGVLGQLLGGWMLVDPSVPNGTLVQLPSLFGGSRPGFEPFMPVLGYGIFFGLVGLAVDWWTMTERDRKSRFRVVPVLKASLLALIPSVLFFSTGAHPFALPAVILTSVVVQLASPWSEAGARYAVYARANKINKSRSVSA